MTQSLKKIDSNITGLAFCEETALKTIPAAVFGSGVDADVPFGVVDVVDTAINDTTRDATITITVTDYIDIYVRLVQIRNDVSINNNAGFLISADPLTSGNTVESDPNSLVKFDRDFINIATEDVSLVVDLSGLPMQDEDIIQVQVANNSGFLNAATQNINVSITGGPTWYELEPNSYDDFGGEITTVARNPINASRQRKKGVVTDLDASGGFNTDFTQHGLTRLLQGFFFADAHEKVSTAPFNGAGVTISSISATQITFTEDVSTIFKVNHLIFMSGFGVAANNGFKRITAVAGAVINVTGAIEASAPVGSRLEIVGIQLTAAECNLDVTGPIFTISSTAVNLTTLGLNIGEWIFIGGDDANTFFAVNTPGYARIKTIAAGLLTLELPTWEAEDETGTGKTIQIFFGTFLRNENQPGLIKRRTYQLERTLGEDDQGIQAEYLVGAVANELKMNIPSADKLNGDISFQAITNEVRDGTQGLKDGPRVEALREDAFNTSSDIFLQELYILSDDLTPSGLFFYALEGSLAINNNATGLKAIGVLGSFDINVGDFEVDGELNCYFTEVAAIRAVRNNANVGYHLIAASRSNNEGFIYDIPLLSLGGGRLKIEKDNPIMMPVENMGAENPMGYTLSATYFQYLPTVAMPPEQ